MILHLFNVLAVFCFLPGLKTFPTQKWSLGMELQEQGMPSFPKFLEKSYPYPDAPYLRQPSKKDKFIRRTPADTVSFDEWVLDTIPQQPIILKASANLIDSLPVFQIDPRISQYQEMWDQPQTRQFSIPIPLNINVTAVRNVFQNLFNAFAHTFQEFVNRQQAFLDLIYCPNCGANPWQNFLTSISHVPTLSWVLKPPHNHGNTKPQGTFIAATNVNGAVSGVGGSIYNGEPIVEYTFNNNHVTPVKPKPYREHLTEDGPKVDGKEK